MIGSLTYGLLAVLALALAFDYVNGFHDTANAIATSVSTRALKPQWAIAMSAAANFAGALTGTEVAKTVGNGGRVLFVGTKKQAQQAVKETAIQCGQFYVTERWLGGTLTNFSTIKRSIARMPSKNLARRAASRRIMDCSCLT